MGLQTKITIFQLKPRKQSMLSKPNYITSRPPFLLNQKTKNDHFTCLSNTSNRCFILFHINSMRFSQSSIIFLFLSNHTFYTMLVKLNSIFFLWINWTESLSLKFQVCCLVLKEFWEKIKLGGSLNVIKSPLPSLS